MAAARVDKKVDDLYTGVMKERQVHRVSGAFLQRCSLRFVGGLLGMVSVVTGCSDTESARPVPGSTLDDRFRDAGFAVGQGAVEPFFVADCEPLVSCFSSNASSPYGLYHLPPAPGAELPPARENPSVPSPEGLAVRFQLAPREALVVTGRTPPSARYFALTPYVFDRVEPTSGERSTVFASLADSVNMVNIHTDTGEAFDAEATFVITADQATESVMRTVLEASGVPAGAINTLVLSSEVAKLGTGADADTLFLLNRYALFDDPSAGDEYLTSEPFTVRRLTPTEIAEASPFPTPVRKPRGNGSDEDHLAGALDALEQAIRAAHQDLSLDDIPIAPAATVALALEPGKCLKNLTNCQGDNRDAAYSAGPLSVLLGSDSLLLGDDDFFVAFGVNHEATGKAVYSNVVVNHAGKQAGVAAFESPDMPGSAARYLPDHSDVDKLFAVTIRRDCGSAAHCIAVPRDFPGVPSTESLMFLFRAYVQPGMDISADPKELLPERVLHVGAAPP